MTSVLSRAPSPHSSLPDFILRRRLSAVRDRLLELERCAPPEHRGDLGTILEVTENTLLSLGWEWPEPLSEHDQEFLAAASAL